MYSLPPSLSTTSVGLTLLGPLITENLPVGSHPDRQQVAVRTNGQLHFLPVQRHPEPASAVGPHIVWVARQVSEVL